MNSNQQCENLELLANLLQVANYIMNVDDAKNTDIIKELNRQNKEYLERIIEQNNEILSLLREG